MTVEAEKRAINMKSELYKIEYTLIVRACIAGEAQKKEGENYICVPCTKGFYLLEAPPPKTERECDACPAMKAKCEGGSRIGPMPTYWR
jgi:hypothetical protein